VYVNHALDYIRKNYDTIRVTDVARYIGINRSYLTNIFKKKMGVSPQEYLLQYRLDKGSKLLLETRMSIQEVAQKIGYDNPLTFSKMFKSVYGVSPRNYRLQGGGAGEGGQGAGKDSWELSRNKLCRAGAELVVLGEAGKRSATLCNTSFPNEAQDNQGKSELCGLFWSSDPWRVIYASYPTLRNRSLPGRARQRPALPRPRRGGRSAAAGRRKGEKAGRTQAQEPKAFAGCGNQRTSGSRKTAQRRAGHR
jgi:AraC-like DNA-binding protein